MATIQRILFPMWNVGISQREYGTFSHQGINAIDMYGKNTGIESAFAPVDCKAIKKFAYVGMGNAIIFQSNAKVLFADGTIDYCTFMMMHDNKISDIKLNKTYKQGTKIYDEGTYGYATGNHIHFEIAKGKYKGFASNGWSLKGHINTTKALWLLTKHAVYGTLGSKYKGATSATYTYSTPKIKALSKTFTMKVTASAVNVRHSYSTTSKVYRLLKKNATFKTRRYIETNNYRWLEYINIKKQQCWVAYYKLNKKTEKYLKIIK